MPRLIISGDAGDVHQNTTGKIQYQLIVQWRNSCGLCIQNDHMIGDFWPTPFHRRCNCTQLPIFPEHFGEPFVDFRAKIHTVSPQQQSVIIGRSNLTLVERGVVEWADVVTSGRVRSLREVVARKKLSVDEMVSAGVAKARATEAYDAVHTATHTASEKRRSDLVESLLSKGYTREQIRDAAGRALGSRLSIGHGPSGPSTFKPTVALHKSTPSVPPKPEAKAAPEKKPSAKERIAAMKAARLQKPAFIEAIRLATEAGVSVRIEGHADLELSLGIDKVRFVPAAYSPANKEIQINQYHEYWNDNDAWMKLQDSTGWLSSKTADHPAHHEIGHALHDKESPTDFKKFLNNESFPPAKLLKISGKVSKYAETQPIEFVAEVYAGIKAGKVYDEDVMSVYREFGGPKP